MVYKLSSSIDYLVCLLSIWTWFCYAVLIIKILNSSGLTFKLQMKNISNELLKMYSILQTSVLISILPHYPWKQDKAF